MTGSARDVPVPRPGDVTGVPHPGWMDPLMAACTDGSFDGLLPRRRPPEDRGPNEVGRPHRDAAVLVLFSGSADAPGPHPPEDARVLLTHRAPTLRNHSGQISFPGGGVDDTDSGPVEAALREAWEETGLESHGVDVLAVLPELYIPVSNYSVAPVLAYWREPMEVSVVDTGETARVMTVPVGELLDPANRFLLRHSTGWTGPAFQHDDLVVWGFTAGILAAMFHSAGWDLDWDTEDIRDLEETLAASGNGEQYRMSAEEARRESADPLADSTVAGVPGVRSGLADITDDSEPASRTSADAARIAGPGDDDEEPLDLPADDPRRGYR
jgi:8-oxo-dGTP pyrophosphatase MutT (NUDIX family)